MFRNSSQKVLSSLINPELIITTFAAENQCDHVILVSNLLKKGTEVRNQIWFNIFKGLNMNLHTRTSVMHL